MKKTFSKLSAAQKRIAVAKDVIARLKTKQFAAKEGDFVCPIDDAGVPSGSVQKALKNNFKCTVCAKGGLFMSYVGFVNKFDFASIERDIYYGDIDSGANVDLWSESMTKLSKIFSKEQLSLIETAFEGMEFSHNIHLSTITYSKACKFYSRYKTDNGRLKAICEILLKIKVPLQSNHYD